MRRKIYNLLENNAVMDIFMIVVIVLSIVPLYFKTMPEWYNWVDTVAIIIFIMDYLLRWLVADYIHKKDGWAFLCYPFTLMAIVDLISILPWFLPISKTFTIFRIVRLLRALRVLKVFKYIKASRGIQMILGIMRKQKTAFVICLWIAAAYIVVSATIMFNVEPETFQTFFDAVYWAVVSLTTVGYGDIYAVTTVGKVITMISAIFGMAVVAMPAGIITAGFLDELKENLEKKVVSDGEKQENTSM